ncbi:hypothetical protein QFC20_007494 [Naganishia adeliensis]|uniref:Uncharacterized protein n=1 Tax=Naganishia adeliensis TaxID=92952 RepID=A0ACC2UYR9_9TREE|nr:hypothetical protein QFC20_007494 [Naganishia adeliensis]
MPCQIGLHQSRKIRRVTGQSPGDLRLPYDVIALVAELLASETDDGFDSRAIDALVALNCLNRTSRTVHEVTLPFLYEKVLYDSPRSMAASLWQGLPKGFKHTK